MKRSKRKQKRKKVRSKKVRKKRFLDWLRNASFSFFLYFGLLLCTYLEIQLPIKGFIKFIGLDLRIDTKWNEIKDTKIYYFLFDQKKKDLLLFNSNQILKTQKPIHSIIPISSSNIHIPNRYRVPWNVPGYKIINLLEFPNYRPSKRKEIVIPERSKRWTPFGFQIFYILWKLSSSNGANNWSSQTLWLTWVPIKYNDNNTNWIVSVYSIEIVDNTVSREAWEVVHHGYHRFHND